MSRRKSGQADIQSFTFRTMSPSVAQRFRDYCYQNRLIMGAVIEDLIAEYLVRTGCVADRQSFEIEDSLSS